MCGRYTLRTSPREVIQAFDLLTAPDFSPRFNIAPTQDVAAVRRDADTGQRRLDLLHWGLVPSWADDPKIGNRMINARADTIATKPAFRSAFRQRRGLIVADGFYEWQKVGKAKRPQFVRHRDGRPFAFAGLWDRWKHGELAIESCTIITTEANGLMWQFHDRMPVILQPGDYDAWLDSTIQDRELEPLLRPAADDLLTA